MTFAEPARDLNPVDSRQHHVEQDEVELRVLSKGERRGAVVSKA